MREAEKPADGDTGGNTLVVGKAKLHGASF